MAVLEQRFDELDRSTASRFDRIDQKLDGIIKTLEDLPKTYATKKEYEKEVQERKEEMDELKTNSVSVSSFRAYQVVLGAISMTALAYLVNLALQRIFP